MFTVTAIDKKHISTDKGKIPLNEFPSPHGLEVGKTYLVDLLGGKVISYREMATPEAKQKPER